MSSSLPEGVVASAGPKGWLAMDGRWLAGAMVIAYFCLLTAWAMVLGCDIGLPWNAVGVPALPQHFQDVRDIAVGVDRFDKAQDPWSADSIAYSVEAFSYPKWWLGIAFLGLNLDTFYFFGFCFTLAYFGCALFVFGRLRLVEGLLAGLLLISPAVMTGVERGNGDLLIFAILTVALIYRSSLPRATGTIVLAAFLKLYPAVVLLVLARPPWRKSIPWMLAALALIGTDLLTSGGEISQIQRGILHMQYFSFGTTPILIGLIWVYPANFDYSRIFLMGSFLYIAVLAISAWKRPRIAFKPEWERQIFAYRIGASIFIGTYALGTNYDYRTMMLAFCLPLLFTLMRSGGRGYGTAVAALTCIIVYTNWYAVFQDTYGTGLQFFIKQLIGWGILGCLSAILAGTFLDARMITKTEVAVRP